MKHLLKIIFLVILFFIILSISIRYLQNNKLEYLEYKNYNLQDNGVIVIKNILSAKDLEFINKNAQDQSFLQIKKYIHNNKNILKKITETIGTDYIFQDYILTLKKSQIHICHRDNNATFYNKYLKYPSYTIIFYLKDMDKCLDIIPNTHTNINKNIINLSDYTKSIICNKGDAIIFNANLIHTGSLNKKENNLRIQMKLTHKNDIKTLNYYQNYNKMLNKENTNSKIVKNIHKHISCQFPIISDLFQTETSNIINPKKISLLHKLYSLLIYNDSLFYNLPTIKK
jgi:ectoine hydroxylase-related dioxygenase (phytanoyl-CoA dioxygenase family)